MLPGPLSPACSFVRQLPQASSKCAMLRPNGDRARWRTGSATPPAWHRTRYETDWRSAWMLLFTRIRVSTVWGSTAYGGERGALLSKLLYAGTIEGETRSRYGAWAALLARVLFPPPGDRRARTSS